MKNMQGLLLNVLSLFFNKNSDKKIDSQSVQIASALIICGGKVGLLQSNTYYSKLISRGGVP